MMDTLSIVHCCCRRTAMKFIYFLAVSGCVSSVNCFILGIPSAARSKVITKRPISIEGAGCPTLSSQPYRSSASPLRPHATTLSSSTALFGKIWDRLEVEPDTRKRWYILNCIAFTEMDCLYQCRAVCRDMPKSDVDKFVVPTKKIAKSRNKKNIIEDMVLYPGYVFAKVRLCPEVYERLQGLDSVRSWMGTIRKKGYKVKPSIPTPLQPYEVEQFQGLEEAMQQEEQQVEALTKSLLEEYGGLEIDGMVKVKEGQHKNEDGIVKRLKDGKVCVRMYTYGTQFDEWFDPTDVRPLTEEEVRKGIQGPERPINQERFNEEMVLPPPRPRRVMGERGTTRGARESARNSLRSNLMGSMGGARRNRRQDRVARGDKFKADAEARARKERQYWEEYQGDQRKRKQGQAQRRSQQQYRQGPGEIVGNEYDVGSQWGRPKKKTSEEERALSDDEDWSAFMGSDTGDDEDDDFFDDLLSELSGALDEAPPADNEPTPGAGSGGTSLASSSGSSSEEDSFFDSLEQELSSATSEAQVDADVSGDEDDFFTRLEQEMGGSANRDPSASSQKSIPASDDEFFSSLEDEINAEADAPLVQDDSSLGDDQSGDAFSEGHFFDSLEEELAGAKEGPAESATPVATSHEDDLFASLERDLDDVSTVSGDVKESGVKREVRVKKKPKASQPKHDPSKGDELASLTVPVLKERLRERGLKVSGRKAELIERLLSS